MPMICKCKKTQKIWVFYKRDDFSFRICLRCGKWWEESLNTRRKIYHVDYEYVVRHVTRWGVL